MLKDKILIKLAQMSSGNFRIDTNNTAFVESMHREAGKLNAMSSPKALKAEKLRSLAIESGKLEAANAGKLGLLRRVGSGFALAAGLVLGASVVDSILDNLKDRYDTYQLKGYFEKMLEAHPQLKGEDPKLVAKYWESLAHFSPIMAKDPLASGAFITQSITRISGDQFGGPPPDTYQTLGTIQQRTREGNKKKDSLQDLTRSSAIGEVVGSMF